MNREEYKIWYRKFSGTMPSVHKWFINFDANMQSELAERWYRTLINVELEHAKTAIDDMFDEVIKQPDRWEYAVRAIAKHAKKLAFDSRKQSRMVDGQPTVACNKCQDEGVLEVWHTTACKSASAALRAGKEWDTKYKFYTGMVPCVCNGENPFNGDLWVRYDRKRTKAENVEALLSRLRSVAQGVEWTPPELETSNHEDPW